MRMTFDAQLHQLNDELVAMGGLCEEAITSALRALTEGDTGAIDATLATDARIDQAERDIEALCLKLLLRQQPVARDLRQISSALKMISDMERIGDQASDIAEICNYLLHQPHRSVAHLKAMSEEAIQHGHRQHRLLRPAGSGEGPGRHRVRRHRRRAASTASSGSSSTSSPPTARTASTTSTCSWWPSTLERIGDHATNIAEWVEYRHHRRPQRGLKNISGGAQKPLARRPFCAMMSADFCTGDDGMLTYEQLRQNEDVNTYIRPRRRLAGGAGLHRAQLRPRDPRGRDGGGHPPDAGLSGADGGAGADCRLSPRHRQSGQPGWSTPSPGR